MCGIAGLLSPEFTGDVLERMTASLAHRGPDERGTFRDGQIGMAHTRLSIIDLSTGSQPIFNEDGTVVVIFNGEIYNHIGLRSALSNLGHQFATETDTEVLVHLYEERGLDFLNDIDGMFALAIWDVEEERLILARDRMGIKPLLLANDGESISFASELPALLESNVDHGGIDETSIAQYFGLGYIPAPRTAFTNIRKVHPGEVIVVSDDGIDRSRFYNPSVKKSDVSFSRAVNELRRLVEDAVEKRLMSDVPLGAFLSGGVDSSIVVGTMAGISDEPVNTFTVGFKESLFDESWAARELAHYHDTNHTEYTVTPEKVRQMIPDVLNRLGEPFADQSLVPTYIVARETSDDVKVALSGDGADELFAGYSRYRGEYYSGFYRRLPRFTRTRFIEPIVNSLNASRDSDRGEMTRKVQKFVRGGIDDVADRHFEWTRILDDESSLAFDTIAPVESGREVLRSDHEAVRSCFPSTNPDDMSSILTVDTHYGLPNQILHKTDLASMYNSLEVRVPFLDTEVVEYARSLPSNYKITPRRQKRVLKRAFDDVLPKSILERGKQGFDMPVGEWFKNELQTEFKDTVRSVDTDLIDVREVQRLFEDHRKGKEEYGKFLWSVYVFARWYDRMEQNGVV